MTPDDREPTSGLLELPSPALALLAEAVLALRTTGDLGVAWGIASSGLVRALGASDARLLRMDRRSGTLFRFDETGVETPYLAEHGGPIQWAMRQDRSLYDAGTAGPRAPRETLLWQVPPGALATVPLMAGSTSHGFLLVAFAKPRLLSHAERLFVQSLADALALALERTELRGALEIEQGHVARLERRLGASLEDASGLLSICAYELRSPLATIQAYAETLATHLANPEAPRERFLEVIAAECQRLATLVSDVHDLARLEGGECPLRLGGMSLKELGEGACASARVQAERRGVRIELQLDGEGDRRIDVDGELARRALAVLVQNAVQFSPDGGAVRVEFGGHGEEWTFAVTDSGPPLPAEDLAIVFEGFYRARREGAPAIEGTRLGLAIAREIVRLHGGRLWAEQPSPHEPGSPGARFCVAAPIRQMASPRARRIARQTVGRDDLRALFDATAEMVAVSLEADIVSLVLVDPDRGDLFVAAAVGLDQAGARGRRTTLRSGVAGSVAAWGRPVRVENIETDRRFKRLNHPQYRTKSLLCVPLRVEGEVIGVINVNNKSSGDPFDEDDLALLVMLTERVGSAIERACAYADSPRVVDDALETVRCMTRLKRELALGGRQLVKRARATARELGLPPADVDVIGYVASIHDVGMIRLEAAIGQARGLDEAERHALAAHPEVSVEILRPLEYLGVVRELILTHHERWDGTGYPRGLHGEEIPLGGRILAVVDAWESMTTPRPYRGAQTPEEASAELVREAGQQFDVQVVEAFLRVLGRESGDTRAAA